MFQFWHEADHMMAGPLLKQVPMKQTSEWVSLVVMDILPSLRPGQILYLELMDLRGTRGMSAGPGDIRQKAELY